MNKVVTIAAAKGGVTKTTSSMYLAASAVRKDPEARVRVMATDPQSCAARWALEAEESGSPLPFEVVDAKLLDVERLAGDGFEGLTIIDTPPAGPITVAAVEAADFVVVPCTDTELDLQQAWSTLKGLQGRAPAAVLLCRVEPHTRLFKAVSDALAAQQTPRFDAVIRKRQAIKACMGAAPGKLYEYAEAYGELEDLLEGVSA